MPRLPLLGVLFVAVIVAASAWLAIDARTDPQPLPFAEHLPRDDEQSQSEESQDQPEPGPEEEADQELADEDSAGEDAAQESQEDEDAEPTEPLEPVREPVDVLIAALDVPRPQIEPAPKPETTVVLDLETYVVETGDTLADIAETLGIELHDLIAANELDSPDLLYVGHELAVPVEVVATELLEETEPSFEPVEIAPAITGDGIVYGTVHDHEHGVVNSAVIATSLTDASLRLVEACVDGVRRTYIMGLSLPEGPTRIYWRFDEGPLSTDRWTAGDDLVESNVWCPFLHTLDEQEGIRMLWIRIGGQDLTFGIENLIPDEILVNFSYCGN
ncbi:MAG: LysM peptidoglycan-binding domain-containing protein [Chloroflexi bacterium]|nr:LysM peptidoglycan-binding domain-containing protein [Chloroflexota bacterium]MCY3589430.1 LysM peptidoglycan-binding domain-containing protein [Chloroflexota bacterium]MCY3684990.1 LysM peptidoglycan-binding domain-containing protein [Chloroflexota bacterium]MDE2707644.1 LysM peptidoglycan-binding domain-containing protein [Chloroflexota bacterium]